MKYLRWRWRLWRARHYAWLAWCAYCNDLERSTSRQDAWVRATHHVEEIRLER